MVPLQSISQVVNMYLTITVNALKLNMKVTTTLLKVILGALLIFAVGYAPWLSWYISKHERLRMESGEWGTATLSSEDEKSWKRSNTGTILASVHLRYCVPCIYFLEIPESISIPISWKTLSRSLPPTS